MTLLNQTVSVRCRRGAPPDLAYIATVEFTDKTTWLGPVAMVQSGGIHPVAAIPAKFVVGLGVAAGATAASCGASVSTPTTPRAAISAFWPESLDSVARPSRKRRRLAFSFRRWNSSSGMG